MAKISNRVIETIEKEMDYWKVPGAAIAVIKDGELFDSIGFGYRNIEQKLKVNSDTQFGIASCSKSMTSALIAILVDKGIINYDEPVTKYAPKLIMYDPAAKNMTLRDMLLHKTGFGTHDALWPGDIKRDELAERIKHIVPCSNYRGDAIYSNVIYALSGYVAECATGKCWEELMQEYIFDPLEMTRTNCSIDIMSRDMNYSTPYRYRNNKLNPLKLWNVDLAGPAASVNSTANDMAKWLMMHIAAGKKRDGIPLIETGTFKEMHSAQSKINDSIGNGYYECSDYSMGWKLGKYKEREFHKHTGKIEGFSSFQAYMPVDKAGVAILTNLHSPMVPFMYSVLYTILDEILGEEYEDWAAKFHGEEHPKEEDYHDCDLDFFTEEQIKETNPTLDLSGYVGTYYDLGYGTVSIDLNNNVLHMHYRDMDIPLKHYHYDVFSAEDILEDIFIIKAPVSFKVHNGRTEAVAIRFESMVPDIVFRKVSCK